MSSQDPFPYQTYIPECERRGLVTRTFRRLDPERQQAVFQAILDEAIERGPADLNIKNVAARAGVAVGSLYQYFANRERMLDFAIELCVRYMQDMFQAYTPMLAAMPLRDALHYYLLGGLEWSQTEASLVRFFGRAAYHGDPLLLERLVRPVAETMRGTVGEILSQAIQRGEVRPGLDLQAVTRIVNVLIIAAGDAMLLPYLNTYFQVTDENMPPERVMEALLDTVLEGIASEVA
jgi:AcrR family transcriptional regulator